MTLTGHCLCGRITWSSPGPVLWAGHCHCDSCRRACSAPYTSFFGVPRDMVTWSGTPALHSSSQGQVHRTFCAACGSQLSYQYTGWPDETHLYAATLDDPAKFAPQAHYHYAERLPSTRITDNLPKYPGSAETTHPED